MAGYDGNRDFRNEYIFINFKTEQFDWTRSFYLFVFLSDCFKFIYKNRHNNGGKINVHAQLGFYSHCVWLYISYYEKYKGHLCCNKDALCIRRFIYWMASHLRLSNSKRKYFVEK